MTLAERIRKLREAAGLTQAQLAERVNEAHERRTGKRGICSDAVIAQYEGGASWMRPERVADLSAALNLENFGELFAGVDELP